MPVVMVVLRSELKLSTKSSIVKTLKQFDKLVCDQKFKISSICSWYISSSRSN